MNLVDGYKVYAVGAATIAYGIFQFYQGDASGATQSILLGLGMLFGRHTLSKIEKKVEYNP